MVLKRELLVLFNVFLYFFGVFLVPNSTKRHKKVPTVTKRTNKFLLRTLKHGLRTKISSQDRESWSQNQTLFYSNNVLKFGDLDQEFADDQQIFNTDEKKTNCNKDHCKKNIYIGKTAPGRPPWLGCQ